MVTDPEVGRNDESIPEALARGAVAGAEAAATGLAKQARSWLRWLGGGAAGGAIVCGGAGLYFFGWNGLALGAVAGAVLGALLVVTLYALAATADFF